MGKSLGGKKCKLFLKVSIHMSINLQIQHFFFLYNFLSW